MEQGRVPASTGQGGYRRLRRRLVGILLPSVRGLAAWLMVAGRSKRLGTGVAGLLASKPVAPGLSVFQSGGGGRGSKPSTLATGMTMLIKFSILVSSSP